VSHEADLWFNAAFPAVTIFFNLQRAIVPVWINPLG
jgi:hypothetical protein